MRTGIATLPLHWGRCPKWLFKRMKKLARGITIAITEEFGAVEFLKRIADPIWFQSLGCVLSFDWHSSGVTTTTLGAIKDGIFDIQDKLGIYICGGKGKTSRKTPQEIQKWGEILGWEEEKVNKLVYASRMSAKIDSALIQDQFQIYAHNLIFTKSGQWTVVQQGMNIDVQKARRYHWLSLGVKDFVEEPHSGIISDFRTKPLNLTAKQSRDNRVISTELITEEPQTFLKDIKRLTQAAYALPWRSPLFGVSEKENVLMRQKKLPNFVEMELKNVEFYWHPVVQEKFDLKRLEKTILYARYLRPKNFEELLAIKGVGPKTIRALSLVSEIIYGAKPSYEDPARYSFSHGGKDGIPYFPSAREMDLTIYILEKGIKKAKISQKEKDAARKRLQTMSA